MAWTLTTSGSAIRKAGERANSTIVASGSALADWSNQSEGRIVADSNKNWVSQYATLSDDIKNILSDTSSDLIAMKIITYNMQDFTSRTEAQTMLDMLRDNALGNMRVLKDMKSNEVQNV